MSRLGGLGSVGGVRFSSNALQAATMSGFIDKSVRDNCDNEIEKCAVELSDLMKRMILTKEAGLVQNTAFTQQLKGGNIPLVETGQLVQSITWKRVDAGKADLGGGKTNTFSACFVGVMRTATLKVGGNKIGDFVAIPLVNIAKKMVMGYTVKMPHGVTKKVPKRDFRKKPYEEYKSKFQERMGSGVASAYKTLGSWS